MNLERLDAVRDVESFRSFVWDYASEHRRSYPWRETHDPWEVLVSEVMLQQTQTDRVVSKYRVFLDRYPVPRALAESSVEELLGYWKGLGYNRRGLNLLRCARMIVDEHGGRVPRDEASLLALPGVGSYTARAVLAFAFAEPVVLIETNIRRLFIHVFFKDDVAVDDRDIIPLIEEALDRSDPREWYYALMDVGSELKRHVANPNRKSKQYARQSRFEGSNRQIRGAILGLLLSGARDSDAVFALNFENERIASQLEALEAEGFLVREDDCVRLL